MGAGDSYLGQTNFDFLFHGRPTQNFGNPKKRGVAMHGQIAAIRGYSLRLPQCSLQPLSGPELL